MENSKETGGSNEKTAELGENERKITTPEEANEMTCQRREEFGLGEKRELMPEEKEKIEAEIGKLLETLHEYDFKSLSEELQEEWYWAEEEANNGRDREIAKSNLENFVRNMEGLRTRRILTISQMEKQVEDKKDTDDLTNGETS